MSLSNDEEDEVISLNWLRNPFGLERWAELNVGEKVNLPENERLWDVCNRWTYDKSNEIDRKLFKKVVDIYWSKIQNLQVGYFVFDLPGYRQMVEGPVGMKLTRRYYEYRRDGADIAIRMECFKRDLSLDNPTLEKWKEWFHRLVVFAEKLQDPNMEFYCSV